MFLDTIASNHSRKMWFKKIIVKASYFVMKNNLLNYLSNSILFVLPSITSYHEEPLKGNDTWLLLSTPKRQKKLDASSNLIGITKKVESD